ncbi:antitoxin Xre/MbcA/ParS toxin-binding domain-containing protein [Erwinia sp. ACCC 02193]|jgi:hypothetical protein|uniref:Antitoxin Xre/MbcA/ParS toxin-binding domain-containing protein n=1 Tax=Erwinia aeris TaxID=3239803 RepID=A0ABV4E878_9GAMM|nr:antitoxin Xre/MbcA/ParS toxin-binding domain-containing protein [Erwinia sp. BC051422]MDN8542416.1 DUF2384 domain-containing protein [Erwinia sp. BC051422]
MSAIPGSSGIATLVGTPKEIQARLNKSQADRVLAMTFVHQQPGVVETLTENIMNMTVSLLEVLRERQEQSSLERLAEIMLPSAPVSPTLLKEAAMLIQARKAVLESGDWLTAAEVAGLAGFSARNPSAQPHKWKKQQQIFTIQHHGIDYYPAWALAADTGFRPCKALAEIIKIFTDSKDGWGMAYWFRADNSALGGRRPQDLLLSSPEQVIEAAKDEVEGVEHG